MSCKLFEASGQHPILFHQARVTKHVYQACLVCLSTEPVYTALPAVLLCAATLAGHALSTPFHKPVYPDAIPHSFHTCCHSHVICCQVTTLIIALCQHLYILCRCTLIDPRPQKLSKTQRKWLQHFNQHRSCVTAGTEVTSNTAVVDCSDAETPAAGQGNDLPASADSSPDKSASTAATTIQNVSCAATKHPFDHTAAQEHLPASASALPPIDQPASDDNLTSGDARTHATCSDLPGQAFTDIPMDSSSPLPASLEPAPANPQPHPANLQPAPVSPQPATANGVMSFSRHGPAAAEVASLTHGPHGDEVHAPTHWSGVQNSREDLRGSLSQQIQVTAGYQSMHSASVQTKVTPILGCAANICSNF